MPPKKDQKNIINSFMFSNIRQSLDKIKKDSQKISKKSLEQVDKWTSGHLLEQVSGQQSHLSGQLFEQLYKQQDNKTSEQQDNKTTRQHNSIILNKKPKNLSLNQYLILYEIYFNRPFKVKGKNLRLGLINNICKIPYGTVRNNIRSLVKKGYIEKPFSINDGVNKGSTCQVNESLCYSLYGKSHIINSEQVNNKTIEQQNNRTSEQQSTSYISSSSLNKETTTIKKILEEHPELGYWRQKGITVKNIKNWALISGCSFENIIKYLCYCRFDMVELNQEKEKSIDNVFNWFFRILEKAGNYPKPKNYKSYKERQLKEKRIILAEKEKLAKEAKEIYRKKYQAEKDKIFWDMMNDPESDIYKKCFDLLNQYQKKRKKGKIFEVSMRSVFDKLVEDENSL